MPKLGPKRINVAVAGFGPISAYRGRRIWALEIGIVKCLFFQVAALCCPSVLPFFHAQENPHISHPFRVGLDTGAPSMY